MQKFHEWFFYLCATEGLIALAALLLIPSEGGTISLARLVLVAIILTLIFLWIYLGFHPRRGIDQISHPIFIPISALLALTFGLLLFLLRYLNPEKFLPYFMRLSPLLWYLLILSIQIMFFLLFIKNGFHLEVIRKNETSYRVSIAVFYTLLAVLFFVALTKIGITKDNAYWGEPGVAILGWQLGLAILVGFGLFNYELRISCQNRSRILNVFLPLLIWLFAIVLWLGIPISSLRNSFYAPITPPYTTPFPYSDAGFYDYLSQSLIIGSDYLGGIPPRPLYVTFLAVLHFLFGQNYINIITAQTLVLALFPVALYMLGRRIHTHAAGVTIAFLAIFRELTTLWISSNTRTASTKMFVTDFVTALGVAITCLIMMWWLEQRDTKSTIIAGGAFGILLLLRTQSLIILPMLLLLAFLAYQKRVKEWITASITFGVVMTMTIAPWLIHNYTVIGKITFDDPAQMAVIYSQYSFSDNLNTSLFNIESDNLGSRLVNFTLKNPGFVGGFIANHFLNTQIGGLLALPLIERFDGLLAPVNLYWVTWDGTLSWYNFALIIFYLVVIAVGIGAAWRRLQWIGLTPLVFNLGYALANGISRFSSWRYNLPVDWVAYFYFGIGSIEILLWISLLFGADISKLFSNPRPVLKIETPKWTYALSVIAFVFIGAIPWLAQGFAEPRYTATADELIEQVNMHAGVSEDIEGFLSQPDSRIIEGMLLYPRFLLRNDGIYSGTPWPVYQVRDYPRLGFILLNTRNVNIVFPTNEQLAFPHGSDAIVLGCARDNYIEARWIYFPKSNETYMNGSLIETCSP